MDPLPAYLQINVAEEDQHKTTFMLNLGRYFFKKTVISNLLSSNTWLKASNQVTAEMPGVFKLVDDLLIGGRDYAQLAERVEGLLKRYQEMGMTLASNKVQVSTKVSFAGYVIDGNTQYPNPKKVEVVKQFTLATTQRELRGWNRF